MDDCVVYMIYGGGYDDDGKGDVMASSTSRLDRIYEVMYGLYKPSECLTLFTSWLGAPR